MQHQPKLRLLFISESVTLAHFARPFELSNQLPKDQYDIHFACDTPCQHFLQGSSHTLHALHSIPPAQFLKALDHGSPLYDFETLKAYVEADLELIEKIKPDFIIGDFRLSLSVSARLAKIPYATISNAYWSPYALKQYPLPCILLTQLLGVGLGGFLFKQAAPIAFKLHAIPMQRLYRRYGLPKIPLDLCRVYTDADFTLYADLPSLFPLANLPSNHCFIGPILWSPSVAEPEWWQDLPTNKPIIYVSMGSSGSRFALSVILKALSKENVTVIVATAGAALSKTEAHSNIFLTPYLDGNAAAARADLVICNGGSLACQQAFAHGKPVIGIATNMDQFLNMSAVTKANAGLVLRSERLLEVNVTESLHDLRRDRMFWASATRLRLEVESLVREKTFETFISGAFS